MGGRSRENLSSVLQGSKFRRGVDRVAPFLFRTSPPLTPRPKSWAICARLQTAANEALEGEIRVGDLYANLQTLSVFHRSPPHWLKYLHPLLSNHSIPLYIIPLDWRQPIFTPIDAICNADNPFQH
jgi:hypothetical protein